MSPLEAGLRQPDARSCGAASMVLARALADPAYGELVVGGAFADEVLALHRRLTSSRDRSGHRQLPWLRAIGTPPWAIAHELATITGQGHEVHLARWRSATAYDRLAAGGALYVGSRRLPRHVVLVLPDGRVYDPASGRVLALDRPAFVAGTLHLAGWTHPWFTITPARPLRRP
ncbi:hypothetical protein BH11ACT8_BH11ACT8_34290 [soil metagenome]